MAEGIVFPGSPPPAPPGAPSQPSQSPAAQPPAPPPPPIEGDDDEEESSFLSKGLIIKVLVGIVVIALLIFLVVRFVVPMFSGNKEDEEVTLTYWGLWEEKQTVQPLLDAFQEQNPKITVQYEKRSPQQYYDSLIARIEKGDGPDVFRFHNSWTDELSRYLAPLPNDVIDPDEFKKQYFPVVQEDLVRDGAIYGIPLGIDTLAMFVNTDILQAGGHQVPKTWIEFEKVTRGANGVTVRNEQGNIVTAGAALGTFNNITHAPDVVSLFLVQSKVDLFNPASTIQDTSDALVYYTSYAKEDPTWSGDLEPSLIAFTQGKLAIYFGYSWDIFYIKSQNPELAFTIHPVPRLNSPMTVASYWADGVSAESPNQEAAYKLLQFLAQKETQQQMYALAAKTRPQNAQFGPPYARRDLAETLKDNALIYPFVAQAEDAVSTPFVSDTQNKGYNDALNTYLGAAVTGMVGNTSPDSAITTFSQGVEQVINRGEVQEDAEE